jgi:hypothetical protein
MPYKQGCRIRAVVTRHNGDTIAIRQARVHACITEEEKTGEHTPLYARAYRDIKSKGGISNPPPMPEAVLVIMQSNTRTHPMSTMGAFACCTFMEPRERRNLRKQAPNSIWRRVENTGCTLSSGNTCGRCMQNVTTCVSFTPSHQSSTRPHSQACASQPASDCDRLPGWYDSRGSGESRTWCKLHDLVWILVEQSYSYQPAPCRCTVITGSLH